MYESLQKLSNTHHSKEIQLHWIVNHFNFGKFQNMYVQKSPFTHAFWQCEQSLSTYDMISWIITYLCHYQHHIMIMIATLLLPCLLPCFIFMLATWYLEDITATSIFWAKQLSNSRCDDFLAFLSIIFSPMTKDVMEIEIFEGSKPLCNLWVTS